MKLIRCHIENFGVLSDFDFSFAEGLTTICQSNGFGKSTFAAFIKAMFYGFPRTGARNIVENERKRYDPWQGGKYGGYLEFEVQDVSYRVTRYFGKTAAKDTFSLLDLTNRRPSTRFSEKLGEELFQLDADSFARSTYVPQLSANDIRKRVGSRLTSTYVDVYSEELYQLLLRNSREARELRKQIRHIEKDLAGLGYEEANLSPRVMLNLDFARANMKVNIYDQAVLEGVATTFPQTVDIIDNGIVSGMTASDVQKILNLKHAWEFILDKDVLNYTTDYHILCHIAKLVNEGFYTEGGRIRGVPVTIGGTSYVPPLPIETVVKETIDAIVGENTDDVDIAIHLCLYCMKAQIFNDGNKRTAVIFANHYMISKGKGLLVIPEKSVPEFKKLLVAYYENRDNGEIKTFMRKQCLRTF